MTTKPASASPVDRGVSPPVPERAVHELKPAAWIDRSGHPKHLSYAQGVAERILYGALEPLYDDFALYNAVAIGARVERERIKSLLLEMHEKHKDRHNYFKCAVVELFPPPPCFVPKAGEALDEAKRRCLQEWNNVNDPPCHPSDDGWKPCALCSRSPVEAG